MDNNISSEDFKKLISTGVLTIGKGNKIKMNTLLPEYIAMLKKDKIQTDLFSNKEVFDPVSERMFKTLTIKLPGEPMSKQSTRFMVSRYFQDGIHTCPWCGDETHHSKGDVVTYRNQKTNMVDCIVKTYTESDLDKRKEEYQTIIKLQLPDDFVPFSEEVHVLSMDFIFHPLASFSNKKMRQIEQGLIIYKTTKPDLPDNLKKLAIDSLTGIVFVDDALIASESNTRKYYGTNPGIIITLKGI